MEAKMNKIIEKIKNLFYPPGYICLLLIVLVVGSFTLFKLFQYAYYSNHKKVAIISQQEIEVLPNNFETLSKCKIIYPPDPSESEYYFIKKTYGKDTLWVHNSQLNIIKINL